MNRILVMESTIRQVAEEVSGYPVSVQWIDRMKFVGTDDNKHSIIIDTSPELGGDGLGPTPSQLMLMAIASCTSMDVVTILARSRQKLVGLSVAASGIQNRDYPKYYKEIHLFYTVKGEDLDASRVERAIRLSEEKYCSVGATVSGKAKIFIKYKIEQLLQADSNKQ